MFLRLFWIMCLLCLCLVPIRAEDGFITALAYSKDGDRLAVSYDHGRLAIYEVEGNTIGEQLYTYQSEANWAIGSNWHPFNDNLLLVTTSLDTLFVVNAATGEESGGPIYPKLGSAAWSADGTQILANNAPDGLFYQTDILDYPSFDTSDVVYTGPILARQFNPTRTREIISKFGNYPETFVVDREWNLLYTFSFKTYLSDLKSASFVDWTNGVIALGDSGYFGIYDENLYQLLWSEESEDNATSIRSLALRPATTQIALLNRHQIRIFDWSAQRDVVTLPIEEAYSQIAWSPDGRFLAIGNGANLFIQEVPYIESGAPAPTQVFYRPEDDRDCGIYAGPMGILSTDEASEDKEWKICFGPYDDPVFQFVDVRPDFSADMTIAPLVERSVIIDGHGTIIERASSEPLYRFFAIAPGGHLTLRNLTFRGGLIDSGKGAAILNQGTLTLDNVMFEYNCIVDDPCDDGDAIYNDGGSVEVVGPVSYSAILLTTLPPTPTPTPTITPVVLDNLTPVLLPTFAPTPTP